MCSRVPALYSPLKLNHIQVLVQPWLPLTHTPPASSNLSMLLDNIQHTKKRDHTQRPEELFEPFLKTNEPMKLKKVLIQNKITQNSQTIN